MYEFHEHRRVKFGDVDRRYRITVLLGAEQRPNYYQFHCVHCGTKVCEVVSDTVALSDEYDITDAKPLINVRCTGSYCKWWYQFVIGN